MANVGKQIAGNVWEEVETGCCFRPLRSATPVQPRPAWETDLEKRQPGKIVAKEEDGLNDEWSTTTSTAPLVAMRLRCLAVSGMKQFSRLIFEAKLNAVAIGRIDRVTHEEHL